MEVRGNWPSNWAAERFLTRVLPDVHDLRREFEGTPCEITTSTMLRDPADQYLSFYHYYIEKNQRRPERGSANENDLDPNAPGPEAWGSDFAEWASGVRDMQVREMLGNKCVRQMREPRFETGGTRSACVARAAERSEARKRRTRGERGSGGGGGGGGGASEEEAGGANANVNVNALVNDDDDDASGCGYPARNGTYSITPADYARFESAVRAMDVVSSTERFDAFLARLRVRVGVRHVAYVASNRGGYRSGDGAFGGGGEGERQKGGGGGGGAERKRVAETVAAVASFDRKAHALATELDDAATREGKAKAGEARAGAKGAGNRERRLLRALLRTRLLRKTRSPRRCGARGAGRRVALLSPRRGVAGVAFPLDLEVGRGPRGVFRPRGRALVLHGAHGGRAGDRVHRARPREARARGEDQRAVRQGV